MGKKHVKDIWRIGTGWWGKGFVTCFLGWADRREAVVREETQTGAHSRPGWPSEGSWGKVTGWGEAGTAASLRGDGVALSVLVLSGLADDRSRKWGIREKKELSAPTTDMGGVSSASISQCSSSKSGAIWTQSCPSYKLSAAPRDCSGSQDSLAHPRASVLMARRADGTGFTRVALHHLVSPVWGSPAEPGEPSPGAVTQPGLCSTGRGHLNSSEVFRMATFGSGWLCYVRHHQSSSLRWVTKQESDTRSVKEQILPVISVFSPSPLPKN